MPATAAIWIFDRSRAPLPEGGDGRRGGAQALPRGLGLLADPVADRLEPGRDAEPEVVDAGFLGFGCRLRLVGLRPSAPVGLLRGTRRGRSAPSGLAAPASARPPASASASASARLRLARASAPPGAWLSPASALRSASAGVFVPSLARLAPVRLRRRPAAPRLCARRPCPSPLARPARHPRTLIPVRTVSRSARGPSWARSRSPAAPPRGRRPRAAGSRGSRPSRARSAGGR